MVADGGRILAVGIPKEPPALDFHSMIFREITLDTTLAHVCDTDLSAALDILNDSPIGHEFAETPVALDRLGGCLDRLADGRVEGKIRIDPSARVH
ncbi:hypothetical protein [Nocardia jiangxiensis]|uniref:Zinc-binding dehydrogenase n=1 Tax=Nocardia jiangxiensis TaxID=282685 RepID=A0ABW6SDD7_9NOCA|nr:hypothetical protein [Nocardia jiangxiensis]